MPGIIGIVTRPLNPTCDDIVAEMGRSLLHEEFYAAGSYSAADIGVHAGWVSLQAGSAPRQLFENESRDVVLLLSGECYADKYLRDDLRQRGHSVGNGPGDWLVHLYEEAGENFFRELNGTFSGLLIDRRQQCAFLFNDRYGLDRVYVHEDEGEIYFASEAKALLRVLPKLRSFDPEGLTDFLTFGSTIRNRTLFRGVQLLPSGSVWKFAGGKVTKSLYFKPEEWEQQATLTADEFEEQFEQTFKRVLPRYCEADSKIGISLTAGLDTRMIMASRPETDPKPVCYTYDGPRGETLDTRLASRIARTSGLEHHILRLESDFYTDFTLWMDRTVYATDGYFGLTGAHEIYFSRKARKLATVRLTGVFGSEVFRGASTFKPLRLNPALLSPEFRSAVAEREREFADSREHRVSFAAFQEIPWNLFGSLAACRSQVTFRSPYLDNELVALSYQAPASLRKSSGPAFRLVQQNSTALAAIPTDMGLGGSKALRASRRIFSKVTFKADYFSNDGLPHWLAPFDQVINGLSSRKFLLGHHKFLRYGSWFRNELSEYVVDSLTDKKVVQNSCWDTAFVSEMGGKHVRGIRSSTQEIGAVLTMAAIERLLLGSVGETVTRKDRTFRQVAS